jgi:hypothetical protein
MKTSTESSQPPTYPAAVPLYVYRELTTELQAVQSKLDVITSHNHKLVQENQELRQEITKMIQSCLELQKLVTTPSPSSPTPISPDNEVKYQTQPQSIPHNHHEVKYTNKPTITATVRRQQTNRPRPKAVIKATHPQKNVKGINIPVSQTALIEEKEVRHYPQSQPESKGLNGWLLTITIIIIIITGFAAGYLIVRPLFQNQIQPTQEIKH